MKTKKMVFAIEIPVLVLLIFKKKKQQFFKVNKKKNYFKIILIRVIIKYNLKSILKIYY